MKAITRLGLWVHWGSPSHSSFNLKKTLQTGEELKEQLWINEQHKEKKGIQTFPFRTQEVTEWFDEYEK